MPSVLGFAKERITIDHLVGQTLLDAFQPDGQDLAYENQVFQELPNINRNRFRLEYKCLRLLTSFAAVRTAMRPFTEENWEHFRNQLFEALKMIKVPSAEKRFLQQIGIPSFADLAVTRILEYIEVCDPGVNRQQAIAVHFAERCEMDEWLLMKVATGVYLMKGNEFMKQVKRFRIMPDS